MYSAVPCQIKCTVRTSQFRKRNSRGRGILRGSILHRGNKRGLGRGTVGRGHTRARSTPTGRSHFLRSHKCTDWFPKLLIELVLLKKSGENTLKSNL